AGLGLWVFGAAAGAGSAGWTEARATPVVRTSLPQSLALAPIGAAAEGASARPIALRLGSQTLAAPPPAGALDVAVPKSLLGTLASQPLVFTGAVRGSVTVESARLVTRSAP